MVKQQHYVPRCYLRSFANSKEQVWVYDKSTDKVFLSSIEGVAAERFFYDNDTLDESAGQEQFIEKALSILEGEAATVIRNVLVNLDRNTFTRLHPDERYFFAQFIAVQMLRTREQRVQMEQISNHLSAAVHSFLTEEMKAASPEQIPPLKVSEKQLAEMQGRFLSNPETLIEYAEVLDSHFWTILRAVPDHAFLSSHHPVGKRANIRRPLGSLSGIASKGIEIVFPLSPTYCFCLFERTHFQSHLRKFRTSENKVHTLRSPANMDYYNYFQVKQSTRFIFGNSDDFTFAKTVCAEEPELRNQSRSRICIS